MIIFYYSLMKNHKKSIWQVIIISIWINVAETIRWLVFAKPYFLSHFQRMNIEPPGGPLNLIVWFIWGILVALLIYILLKKFPLIKTTIIIWLSVYSGIWIMLFNLKVLSYCILAAMAAFCFIEIFIGTLMCKYFQNRVKYQ